MGSPFIVLLASDFSLVRSVIHEMLVFHGYTVLNGAGMASLSVGRSYTGLIHLLVTDADKGGQGGGLDLAEALGYLRPNMRTLFLKREADRLWLVRESETPDEIKIPFTPGHFLEWTSDILAQAFSSNS